MSFRDLRSLTEMMRALGYPRLISLENFRQPNFPLVAEMLIWLVQRFEPNAEITTEWAVSTPCLDQDRVMLIRSVVQFLAQKAHIKLNPKKLYQSDGYAVKELIKVSSVLYSAMKSNTSTDAEEEQRKLGTEITVKGASLYDLLGREVEFREKRQAVLAKNLEIQEVETGLKMSISAVADEIKKVQNNIENVASNEAALEAKIEKKKVELERNQKRLATLKKVRPAFMDEYERLESELRTCYEQYMIRFRCLAYLEQQLEEYERTEQERMEERQLATKKIIEKIKQDEALKSMEASSDLLSDGDDQDETEEDSEDDEANIMSSENNGAVGAPSANITAKSAKARPSGPTANRRVFGSMTADLVDDDSFDSDSDDVLLNATDDSDEELEVNEKAAESLKNRKSAKLKMTAESDDDF